MNLEAWFVGATQRLAIMEVTEVPFHELTDWVVFVDGTARPVDIRHMSGQLYRGAAFKAFEPLRHKVVDRFLLTPCVPKGQMNGVILLVRDSVGKFLVQAKAEPGNRTPGRMTLTATIQASWSNLQQKLSGAIPFVELYDHPLTVKRGITQDGGQFFEKVNEICFLLLPADSAPLEIPENFTWATRGELANFTTKGFVSEHLLQALGIMAVL